MKIIITTPGAAAYSSATTLECIEMPETISDYHQYRENITSTDGVILYTDRVIVPPSLHGEVLSTIHAAHQGVSMMIARAESSVFWPGISADISTTRTNCEHCHRMAPSQPGAQPIPPIPVVHPLQATSPMSHHLIIVDTDIVSLCCTADCITTKEP